MKQKQIGKNLYILTTEPYVISDVGDASVIFVHTNFYDEFKALNPSLELTRYNYMLLRKSEPEYYKYINEPDFVDFEFDSSIQNVSSWIDETKSMILQSLHLPDDYTGTVSYTLNGNVLDSSAFTLENAGTYQIDASIPGTSLYEADTASYSIIYEKFKRNATLSFANAQVSVSTYVDSSYSGTIQQVQNAPENVDIKYYLNNSLLDSSVINLTEQGQYQVKAAIVSDEVYNDTSTSYTINYSKVKRDITLTFPTASVDVSNYVDEIFGCYIDEVTNAPAGVDIHYYLNDVEIIAGESEDGGYEIHLLNAGTYVIKARIINDNVYNDTSTTYTINYTKVKRDAVLSFADSSVNITVEDETSYSGNVQAVSGLPAGETVNYYLDSSLLSGNTISIDNLVEGENSYTVTAAIENSSYYNDASCSYTLNITMENLTYEERYFTIEPLEDGTIKFTQNDLQYSTDNKKTWNTLTADTSLNVTTGHKVLFKRSNPTVNNLGMGTFSSSGQFNVYGNIMSLKYGDNFLNQRTMSSNQFKRLFLNSKVINAENLILPSPNKQAGYCFSQLFNNCSLLIKGPVLQTPYRYSSDFPSRFAEYCYSQCINLSYIKLLSHIINEPFKNWTDNVSTNGIFVKAKDAIYAFGTSGIPYNWKVINNETNKEVYPLFFNKGTVNVSTYTTQNYTGTILDVSSNRAIPNGLVKYYLDSSLLSDNNITLTTTGNHTVLAEIVADSSIDDSSASYTINYQRVKQDVSIRGITFSSPSGQTFDVDEQVSVPTVTYYTYPGVAQSSVQETYSFDGTNYVSQPPSNYLDTSTAGNYTYYVKFKIPSYNMNYNSQEFVKTWEWTVASSTPVGTLTVIYNVTNPNEETQLFNAGGSSSSSSESGSSESGGTAILPTSMTIDGVEETPVSTWRFSTASGEHEVVYTFENNTIPPMFLYNNSNIVSILINNLNISDCGVNGVFEGCLYLTDVQIYGSVGIDIGSYAFNLCTSLRNVYLDQIKTINDYAFYSCYVLSSITIDTLIPPYLGNKAFDGIPDLKIYVPAESVEDYKGATNWQDYASQIYPISSSQGSESESGESV